MHEHDHDHAGGHSHEHPHDHSHDHSTPEAPAEPTELAEQHHQATVCATFDSYLQQALHINQKRRANFWALPEDHRSLLGDFPEFLKLVDSKLQVNGQLVANMIETNPFQPSKEAAYSADAPKEADHERLRSTVRQCARDWTETGKRERDATYTPLLEALQECFKSVPSSQREDVKVLCPGAGLGRLPWEIVRLGFSCQANEFSLFMLITSSFIINHTTSRRQFEFFPYLHSFSNRRNREDLLRPSFLPDVLPSDLPENVGDFSFAAGDFCEVYGEKSSHEQWDAVVTCFFIDTARNIVEYLKIIHSILKPNGVWINIGPTLWHFENDDTASSIELTMEDLKSLARKIGFKIANEREINTSYTSNPLSLLQHEYTASFWTATKI